MNAYRFDGSPHESINPTLLFERLGHQSFPCYFEDPSAFGCNLIYSQSHKQTVFSLLNVFVDEFKHLYRQFIFVLDDVCEKDPALEFPRK